MTNSTLWLLLRHTCQHLTLDLVRDSKKHETELERDRGRGKAPDALCGEKAIAMINGPIPFSPSSQFLGCQ